MSNSLSIRSLIKNRTVLFVGMGAFLLTATLAVSFSRTHENSVARAGAITTQQAPTLIAGPGRVEPSSEDIKIGSELSGRLKVVNVEEGDAIRRGQVLAELENADYRAQVESARANVVAKQAVLRKVINGARRQERDEAWSSVNEAKAVLEDSKAELHRRQELFAAGVVSIWLAMVIVESSKNKTRYRVAPDPSGPPSALAFEKLTIGCSCLSSNTLNAVWVRSRT